MSNNVDFQRAHIPEAERLDSPYLTELMDTLAPFLNYTTYPVGKRISFSANNQADCYFILQGSISLSRQPDDILVEIFVAPSLRGIVPVHKTSQSQFTMRVLETAEMAIIEKEQLYSLLTEHNLWKPYAMHLQLVASLGSEVLMKLVTPSVFERVRYQLYELMSKPQSIRESVTAENYIRSKTRLSRSGIMNALSELRKGGYITIENGHLIDIKHIPPRF